MTLLPVAEAVARILRGVEPLGSEVVALQDAAGRVLAADVAAVRDQPPFRASAMDGYAVRAADAQPGSILRNIGTSRAGKRFSGELGAGEAVRIFTGAPVPDGADAILIQENAEADRDSVLVREAVEPGRFVRRAGLDFSAGDTLLNAGRLLDARAVSLSAAMGHAALPIRRKPRVAVLANGDELVPPGSEPGPDQIVSSNNAGLCAFVRACGGEPIDLGIAPDRQDEIGTFIDQSAGADVLVIVGGASVGEHDLVQAALTAKGMELDFWRIAMRPGKPLIVGTLHGMRVLGLPGNPVSALVCSYVFLRPLIRTCLGLLPDLPLASARLGKAISANDHRQDYVRAQIYMEAEERIVSPFPVQDSSMLATFAVSDALIVRPPHAPAASAGDTVSVLLL